MKFMRTSAFNNLLLIGVLLTQNSFTRKANIATKIIQSTLTNYCNFFYNIRVYPTIHYMKYLETFVMQLLIFT